MIDEEGLRANVGMILINAKNHVFWARRAQDIGWQFPQGGVQEGETPEVALYRELQEEVGLARSDVRLIAESQSWYQYFLPKNFVRWQQKPVCLGQRQKWFLLRLLSPERINLEYSVKPEFDTWCWVDYWYPADNVIDFKQDVYRQVLAEFESVVFRKKGASRSC